MPEENNFHDMIASWRLRSGEIENSSLLSMSGSSDHESPYKHKEDAELLSEKPKASCSVAGPITGTALLTSDAKEELIKGDKNEIHPENTETGNKDNVECRDKNVDENKIISTNLTSTKEKEATDNTDSIYMKQRRYLPDTSVPTPQEKEEDCGVVCLFYMMQCCDCVIA